MRSGAQDIVELFGFVSEDTSEPAIQAFNKKDCPFVGGKCTKINHEGTIIYGTCSVTAPRKDNYRDVIVCPKRLYADNYRTILDATQSTWGNIPLVIGKGMERQIRSLDDCPELAVAFGQNSGSEVTINSGGKLSMDWVVQRYFRDASTDSFIPKDYIGIEIQSIDITGNYRSNWAAYAAIKSGEIIEEIPVSGHGLNWANVHKRLIPQLIRKGNIYAETERCVGFFFILPEIVYKKFEEVLGTLPQEEKPNKFNVSILTYDLGSAKTLGSVKPIEKVQTRHHSLNEISLAFSKKREDTASAELDEIMAVKSPI